EGRFGERLLEQARPEFDQEVGLRISSVPQAVCRARRDGQLLTRSQREPGAVDGKRGGSGDHGKARLLDRMDVGFANTAAGREPGFVLDRLAVRFRRSL